MTISFKTLLISTFLILVENLIAQQDTLKYWIQFTDKNNSPYTINAPEQFLSSKAIARRAKSLIPISEQDLPVNQAYIDQIAVFPSVQFLNPSKWFNAITISCFDTNDLNQIIQLPFVQQIEIVQKLQLSNTKNPIENTFEIEPKNNIEISNNDHFPYGYSYNQNHLHQIEYLHELGFNGEGLTIAVIDAGFETVPEMACFKHLFQENRILSTKDFVDHDGDVYWDHFHGAAVLSTIAGKIDGEYYGTATKANFHLLRSEDADKENIIEEDNWVTAAEYADSAGVDIINSSLGYTQFDDSLQNHTYAQMDGNTTRIAKAADIAASKGILVVASAGNSGANDWKYISTPADADSILTVGAVDSLGNYAFFSSVGPASDGDVKPNVASVGYQTYLYIPYNEKVVRANGTSFSSPMMAGMSACLWQAFPNLNNMEIIDLIQKSAHQYNAPDSLLGYGIPNFRKAYTDIQGNQEQTLNFEIITYYPNPMDENGLKVLLNSNVSQEIQIEISNPLGQSIYSGKMQIEKGQNLISIGKFFTANGIYFLKLIAEDGGEEDVKILGK